MAGAFDIIYRQIYYADPINASLMAMNFFGV